MDSDPENISRRDEIESHSGCADIRNSILSSQKVVAPSSFSAAMTLSRGRESAPLRGRRSNI